MARQRSQAALRKAVLKAIVKGIQRNGEAVFATSQMTGFVPVRTGYLKNTATSQRLPNGYRIVYRASYAKTVHDGAPERPITGTQVVKVKGHKRKKKPKGRYTKGGKYKVEPGGWIVVTPHERHYVNKRLVPIDPKRGIFRVMKKWPERKANPFLLRALKQCLPNLPNDIAFYLKKIRGAS